MMKKSETQPHELSVNHLPLHQDHAPDCWWRWKEAFESESRLLTACYEELRSTRRKLEAERSEHAKTLLDLVESERQAQSLKKKLDESGVITDHLERVVLRLKRTINSLRPSRRRRRSRGR